MANPKRSGKRIASGRKSIKFRVARRKWNLPITSLSDVEDSNDVSFWNKVTHDAATKAINENKAMDIPVTILEDGWVVQKSQDGTTTKIRKVESSNEVFKTHTLTKGSILHVK